MFEIIAHRGSSELYPDNTRESFDAAIAEGADSIETDIQITQDNVLVLFHDEVFNGRKIGTYRLSEILDINPSVMTLDQCLHTYATRIPFCFELKVKNIELQLIETLKRAYTIEWLKKTVITSFDYETILACHTLSGVIMCGLLTREWNDAHIVHISNSHITQICPQAAQIVDHPELVSTAHTYGLKVRAWQIESVEVMQKLSDLGVDGGTVNWPGKAKSALQRCT